jgi:hypothetical protein
MDEELARSSEVAVTLVGLTEEEATRRAQEAGRQVRIGRRDARFFELTLDFRPTRLTVDVVNGVIEKASAG